MNYLSVENLTKSFGDRVLFENISFGISQGDKVALIAANGSGKSTLLKILRKKEIPDSGNVVYRNDISVGFLEQEPELDDKLTVIENLFISKNPLMEAVREYEYCIEGGEKISDDRLNAAIENMEALQAWDYESRTHQILGKLGIHNFDQLVSSLSGGQKKRVALAKLLIEDPEFLVLDEPTNHLDVEMIEWLESYLSGLNKTILLVTHDRYFLDRIATSIIEIDNKTIYLYKGNFFYFLEKKEEREQSFNTEVEKAQNLFKRELEWMRKQPKARTTKSKSRIDSFYEVEEKAHQSRKQETVNLSVNMSRLGNKILELHKVSKAYDEKIMLKKFDYVFRRGERIGIVGKNGVGKSTFLKLLQGHVTPDSGSIETGETIVFGNYSQDGLILKEDKRIIDFVKDFAEFIPVGKNQTLSASQFLQHFQFSPQKQYTFISKLSGGEKRRLHLLSVLMKNPNFLILDEPTNDLDLITLGLLEEFLINFGGCLIVVTHDRYFMDKLVDHLFVFEGDGLIKDFNGTYNDWKNYKEKLERDQRSEPVKEIKEAKAENATESGKKKLSYKEQKEYEELEKEIEKLEAQKAVISDKMNSGISEHAELAKLAAEFEKLNSQLEGKTMRWLELAEMM